MDFDLIVIIIFLKCLMDAFNSLVTFCWVLLPVYLLVQNWIIHYILYLNVLIIVLVLILNLKRFTVLPYYDVVVIVCNQTWNYIYINVKKLLVLIIKRKIQHLLIHLFHIHSYICLIYSRYLPIKLETTNSRCLKNSSNDMNPVAGEIHLIGNLWGFNKRLIVKNMNIGESQV